MACNSCGAEDQERFLAEVSVHFQGLRNVHKLPVLVFPELVVCLNCGKTEFTIPKDEIELLVQTDVTQASLSPSPKLDNAESSAK